MLNVEKYNDAEQLLQDFSVLLRRFLEKSNHSFIYIDEELEIVRLYREIQIRNNDIGRLKSIDINKSRTNHISHGIQLVKQKMSFMHQKHGIQIDLTIEDLKKNKVGTLVTLKIATDESKLPNN